MHTLRSAGRGRSMWVFLLLTVLLLGMAGCGGGGDDPASPAATNTTNDDDDDDDIVEEPLFAETSAVIDAAAEAMATRLATLTIEQAMTATAAEMLTDPCVASAECVVEGDADPYLIAEFTNGMVFLMPVIRVFEPDKDLDAPGDFLDSLAADKATMSLTGNGKAIFIALPQFTATVVPLAELAGQVGFTVDPVAEPRVASFADLNQYSLVYIGTHGNYFKHEGAYYFGLLTSELRDSSQDIDLLADDEFSTVSVILKRGVYIVENEDAEVSEETEYAITDRYIMRHNGSFPDHSLFFADACMSAMRQSVYVESPLGLVANLLGVEVYLGWSNVVEIAASKRASYYLFGNLLGKLTGTVTYPGAPTTPIRPWSLTDTWTGLVIRNWQYDEFYEKHAVLEMHDFSYGEDELLLRPAIRQLTVQVDPGDAKQDLQLLGNFGDTPGKVFVCSDPEQTGSGGSELTGVDWSKSTITVPMQQGQHGYVVVEANGRRSNAHPLSKWDMEISVQGNYDPSHGPDFEITMHGIWRAEYVEERAAPDQDPLPEYGWTTTLFGLDATADYSYSGTFEDTRYIYEFQDGPPNEGTMKMEWDGAQFYFGTATIKPSEGNIVIQASLSREAMAMVTDKQNPDASPVPMMITVSVIAYIDTDFGEDGVIPEGELAVPYNTSWPQTTPEAPPVESTGQ